MDSDLTGSDLKFLSDCGVAVGEPAPDKEADSVDEQDRDASTIYYRRIIEELG